MRRRLFRIMINGLTLLSLLLCVATCVLWVRSYWISDSVRWEQAGEAPLIVSGAWTTHGNLCLFEDIVTWRDNADTALADRLTLEHAEPEGPMHWGPHSPLNRIGFFHDVGDAHGEQWTVPLWWIVVLTVVAPLLRVFRTRSTHSKIGTCQVCGYDLRATPDRCPECGKTTASTRIVEKQAGKPAPQ